jgi:hypothetical protein
MPRGFFDALIARPSSTTSDRFVLVDSMQVDYLTATSDTSCTIHLKDGQLIATLMSCPDVQKLIEEAKRLKMLAVK